jgi:hypothetical protein
MKKMVFAVTLLLAMLFMQISIYAASKQDFYDLFVDPEFEIGRSNCTKQFQAAVRDLLNTNELNQEDIGSMYQEVLNIKQTWSIAGNYASDDAYQEMLLNMTVAIARGAGAAISAAQTSNGWTVSVVSKTGRVYTFVNLDTPVIDPRWVDANENDGFLNPIKATGPGLDFRLLYGFTAFMVIITVALAFLVFKINRKNKLASAKDIS